jgi:hypothetical protein
MGDGRGRALYKVILKRKILSILETENLSSC